jgi:hypothetical protein
MAVKPTCLKLATVAAVIVAAIVSSSCSDFVRSSRSPTQLIINQILVASATSSAVPTLFVSGPLVSDVISGTGTIFNDYGQVTLRAILRDQGTPGVAPTPTDVNDVTITRYRVVYRRSDGHNVPGVDVPQSFDGAFTVTVPAADTATGVFELVRHVAKSEAPLVVLRTNPVVITMIADVTFFGRDQAGNEVSVTGSVQINFADFG